MKQIIILLALVAALGLSVSGNVVTCYYGSWAVWRPGLGRFDVEDIDPFLCTHIVFGFSGLSNHTWEIEVLDPWNELCDDGGRCAFDRFTALKNQNQALKTILAVGGWNEGSEDYSLMAADPEKRRSFIQSSIELVLKHNFDGLDMDWEYPTFRGGNPEDKENFITLLDELRVELDKHNLLLTAAVSAGKPTVDGAYDVKGMARNMDFLHIMTYDFHGAWENLTHHNAPLKGYFADEGDMIYFNVAFGAQYWIDLGVPKEKLVMGIPTYGRCFTLDDIKENGMLAHASEPGQKGPYTRIPGTMGYNEICESQIRQDWSVVHDPNLCEPYTFYRGNNIWCGYDDPDSAFIKARYAKNLGYAGVMVWTIDTDDFRSTCHRRKFHMIKTMKEAFSLPADAPGTEDYCTFPGFMSTTSQTSSQPETTTPMTTPKPETTTTYRTTPKPVVTTPPKPPPTTVRPKPTPTTTPPKPTPTTTPPKPTPTTTPPKPTPTTTPPKPTPTTTPKPVPTTTHEPTTQPEPITTRVPTTTRPNTPRPTTPPRPPTTVNPHPNPSQKPDCTITDQIFFPHEDCNKYWRCANGVAYLEMCAPGTVFDALTLSCRWQDDVDTSHCRLWLCEVDNVYYPGKMCNEYYRCVAGQPIIQFCPVGLFWNQNILNCDDPIHVDTNACQIA
ncbi:chitinase-3-like protein 1 [Oratosquilla oratoria]|uniref:chitinase-3-like protein 1 n=1 Tax=Oratosquilla oratoria TaxID=337810 RepID=UPI003F75DE10